MSPAGMHGVSTSEEMTLEMKCRFSKFTFHASSVGVRTSLGDKC